MSDSQRPKADQLDRITTLSLKAAQGDAEAQFELGQLASTGENGVLKDAKIAAGWFEKAAAHGHVGALCRVATAANNAGQLGSFIRTYNHVLNHPDVQFHLGMLYQDHYKGPPPLTVAEKIKTSREYFTEAAQSGHKQAMEMLAKQYMSDRNASLKDVIQGLEYFVEHKHYYQISPTLELVQKNFFEGKPESNDQALVSLSQLCFRLHTAKQLDAKAEPAEELPEPALRTNEPRVVKPVDDKLAPNYQAIAYRAIASISGPKYLIASAKKFVGERLVSVLKDLSGEDKSKQDEAKLAVQQLLRNGHISNCHELYLKTRSYLPLGGLDEKGLRAELISPNAQLNELGWKEFILNIQQYAAEVAQKIHQVQSEMKQQPVKMLAEREKLAAEEKMLDELARLRLACEMPAPVDLKVAIGKLRTFLKDQTTMAKSEVLFGTTPKVKSLRAIKESVNTMLKRFEDLEKQKVVTDEASSLLGSDRRPSR